MSVYEINGLPENHLTALPLEYEQQYGIARRPMSVEDIVNQTGAFLFNPTEETDTPADVSSDLSHDLPHDSAAEGQA